MVDSNSPAIDTSGISASDSVRYKETETIIIKCTYMYLCCVQSVMLVKENGDEYASTVVTAFANTCTYTCKCKP